MSEEQRRGEEGEGVAMFEALGSCLSENRLLGALWPGDGERFTKYLEILEVPPGVTVVDEGAEGQDMYFILDGEARLFRAHMDLGKIGRGEHFGELALIARRLRAARVSAVSALRLARLSRVKYEAMSAEVPDVALRFTQALVGTLGSRLTEMTDSVGLLLRERSLPRHVSVEVHVGGDLRRVKTGTPLGVLLPDEVDGAPVVAALLNHKAVSLNTPLASDATVTPLTTAHWEGKRVYRHSLGLLLLEAAAHADAGRRARLGPSIGFGQRVEVEGAMGLSIEERAAWAERVTRVMNELIRADIVFRHELWTVEEARSHFEERGWDDAALLLETWRDAEVPLASCGGVYALSMTPLVPSAWLIGRFAFRLSPENGGFLLCYGDEEAVGRSSHHEPVRETPAENALTRPRPVTSAPPPPVGRRGAEGEEPWLGALGVTSVGAFNQACIVGSVSQIIRVTEGLHEKRIGQIADVIAERGRDLRIICVAGPSSSGKTTFIKRLSVQLQVNGIQPVGLSLDDYYLDRDKTARDANGEYDFEALEALDLALLHDHLGRLVSGEEVTTARYDFATGKSLPNGGPMIRLGAAEMLLVEGIHGLNPRLLSSLIERRQAYRIFIQPTTALPFDRLTRVNVSDLRLLRRIVRDRHHRGTNAAANIMRWPSVRAGERAHIFPFLEHADSVFDSALVYEPSVIKVFADRYLLEVPQDHPSFVTAHRLRRLIDQFITIYPDHVPPTSILREFIGGSGFEY